jgi:hypothetical protein
MKELTVQSPRLFRHAIRSLAEASPVARVAKLRSDPKRHLNGETCQHIFSVSAGMVGVCLTVISLLRVVISIRRADTWADDILAMNAVLFLTACLSSYWALRCQETGRMHRLERFADTVFVVAMSVMVFACLFITYAITSS